MSDTNKQDNPSATVDDDSQNNSDMSEHCEDDIAHLEQHLAELSSQERVTELKSQIRAKQERIGNLASGENSRPKQPMHQLSSQQSVLSTMGDL